MTFKEKLVKLRKLKKITQDEFACAVGVSRQAVYKWESGQSYPEVAKLLEMKVLFNISIDDLLDESYEVIVPEKPKKRRIAKADKLTVEKKLESEPAPVVAEPVAEESAPVAEPVAEPEAEPAPVVASVPAEEEKKEAPAEERRRGFFSRLFGRK